MKNLITKLLSVEGLESGDIESYSYNNTGLNLTVKYKNFTAKLNQEEDIFTMHVNGRTTLAFHRRNTSYNVILSDGRYTNIKSEPIEPTL